MEQFLLVYGVLFRCGSISIFKQRGQCGHLIGGWSSHSHASIGHGFKQWIAAAQLREIIGFKSLFTRQHQQAHLHQVGLRSTALELRQHRGAPHSFWREVDGSGDRGDSIRARGFLCDFKKRPRRSRNAILPLPMAVSSAAFSAARSATRDPSVTS